MLEQLKLEDFVRIIKKHLKIILIAILMGIICSIFVTKFLLVPKYQSSTPILVNRKSTTNNSNDLNQIQSDVQMISTYKVILTTPAILSTVSSRLAQNDNISYTPSELQKMISISNPENSQVFSINIVNSNRFKAQKVCEMVANVFKEKAPKIMNVKNVSILSDAQVSNNPISPNMRLNLIIGLLAGLFLGLIISFLIEYFDKTVKNDEFLTDEMHLVNLGIVYDIPKDEQTFHVMDRTDIQTNDVMNNLKFDHVTTTDNKK